MIKYFLSLVLACCLAALLACNSKPKTPGTGPPPTPFTNAAKAADDIAASIPLIRQTEHDLEVQKLITPQVGLKIVNGAEVLRKADERFIADIKAAKAAGSDLSLLIPSLKSLRQAVADLQQEGLLGIKSESAKQTFLSVMNAVNVAIATLETIIQLKTTAIYGPEQRRYLILPHPRGLLARIGNVG